MGDTGLVAVLLSTATDEPDVTHSGGVDNEWGIIDTAPDEVIETDPLIPRVRRQFELRVFRRGDFTKDIGGFHFGADEHALTAHWMGPTPGLPSPLLAVGTGQMSGEDMTCTGRVLVFHVSSQRVDPNEH